jgi:hypothetical protein
MDVQLDSFIIFLSLFWFFVYWVLGGVFFAMMTLLRLGRVRKLRFSCLFTLLAAACGIGSAYFGVRAADQAIQSCTLEATGRAQTILAVFSCGFGGIMSAFLIAAVVLTLGGFVFLGISKTKTKPWIILNPEEPEEEAQEVVPPLSGGVSPKAEEEGKESVEEIKPSKFF